MSEKSPLLSGQGGYGATPYPPNQGAAPYPPPQGATPYPPPQAGYPQAPGGYPAGPGGPGAYPQGQGQGYPQGQGPGGPGGYPPSQAGYQQGPGAPGGYPQGPPAGAAPQVPAYKGETPHEDVKDDPNATAPAPSAPPLDQMTVVQGYEQIGFNAAALPPPSYDDAMQGPPPENREFKNVPSISEEDARAAILQHVAEHCCYGSKAAKEMTIREMKSTSAFHYTLETFTESRSTCWAHEPYRGQPIDGPEGGAAPGPWDIQATPPTMFKPSKLDVEVPHTASVKTCHNCYGRGYDRCYRCHGRGRLFCTSCNGSGRERHYENGEHRHRNCIWCHGSGRKICYTCNGFGQVECSVCRSRGSLKCFIKLTIIWKNHEKDHIVERTDLPDHLIRGVTGQIAFEENALRVWPIAHFPDPEVNNASKAIVSEHARAFPTERILGQRHRVRIVPVTQAFYSWKDTQNGNFFVYGFEHKVHAPDYPQQCCCGCVIL